MADTIHSHPPHAHATGDVRRVPYAMTCTHGFLKFVIGLLVYLGLTNGGVGGASRGVARRMGRLGEKLGAGTRGGKPTPRYDGVRVDVPRRSVVAIEFVTFHAIRNFRS